MHGQDKNQVNQTKIALAKYTSCKLEKIYLKKKNVDSILNNNRNDRILKFRVHSNLHDFR